MTKPAGGVPPCNRQIAPTNPANCLATTKARFESILATKYVTISWLAGGAIREISGNTGLDPVRDSATANREVEFVNASGNLGTNEASHADAPSAVLESVEQEKPMAKTKEPQPRIQDLFSSNWQSWAEAAIKYIAIIVPVGTVVVGLVIQWNEYQDVRERLARFEAGPEVTQLVPQLNNIRDESQRSIAAYQLAWFGRPAVFLLFERLVIETVPAVRDAIILALVDIDRSVKEPPSVMALLVGSTDAFVSLALHRGESAKESIEPRLIALADVAAAVLRSDKVDSASNMEQLDGLNSARKRIESQPSQPLSDDDKKRLLDLIDRIL